MESLNARSATDAQLGIEAILRTSPVIPVLTLERLEDAVPLATALLRGGLRVLEVTLLGPYTIDDRGGGNRECPSTSFPVP